MMNAAAIEPLRDYLRGVGHEMFRAWVENDGSGSGFGDTEIQRVYDAIIALPAKRRDALANWSA